MSHITRVILFWGMECGSALFVGTTRNNSTLGPWPGTDSCRGSGSLHFVEKSSAGMFSMVFAKTMPPKKKTTNYYVPRKCKLYIFRYPCPHDLGKMQLILIIFFSPTWFTCRKQQDRIQEPKCTKASYASMPRFNSTQNQT